MLVLATTHAEDSPRSGTSLLAMEFRTATHHFGPTIPFIDVDVVDYAVFNFLDVNVRSETEDIRVPRSQTTSRKGRERLRMFRRPRLGERSLEIRGCGNSSGLLEFPHSRKRLQIKGLPLSIHFREVFSLVTCPEIVRIREAMSNLF